jgi:hypothetical protein
MKIRGRRLGLWALIAMAVLTACKRERSGSPPPSVELARAHADAAAPTAPTPAAAVTDIATVTGPDAYDLVGRPVQVGATVQQVVSDRAFWMGPSANQRVLVVVVPGEVPPIVEGDTVDVTGTLERVPSAPEGFRLLNLGTQAEDVLRIQIVYIHAARDDIHRSVMQAE